MRSVSARLALSCAAAVLLASSFCAAATAAGPVVDVGTPYEIGRVAVAVDDADDAVLAWSNTKDLGGAKNFVQYCVLPVGGVACAHAGSLIPADGAEAIDNVQVLADGSTIVILADVFGAKGASAQEYEPEQEWQSTDGGATFTLLDGGKSVSDGVLNADTEPLSAVVLPGTGVLGYGWETAVGPPTFNAFPLSAPPTCSTKSCSAGFATLEPETNPDQVGNPAGSQFAAQAIVNPGVLGIFPVDETSGPLGCPTSPPFGIAFAYGAGNQSAANNYNISPGSSKSAWKVPVMLADCGVSYPAVAGGSGGFGVLEDDEATNTVVYHRFDQATDAFDTPLVTVAAGGEQQPTLSQDGGGGVYATYIAGLDEARLVYSNDGGLTWSGPNTLQVDPTGGLGDLTSSVNIGGQGWMAWFDNGSVYAQSFTAADSVPPSAPTTLTTTQSAGGATGPSIAISAGAVGETDRATIAGENAAQASGTVTYTLYSSSACAAPSAVFTSAVAVAGAAVSASAPIAAALAPGTYYWQASYSGDPGAAIGGIRGNQPSVSACGSEVLTVLPPGVVPDSAYTVEHIQTNPDGTVTITLVPAQAGEATLVVTVPTAAIARAAARDARRSKKCHRGQVRIKGRCRPQSTVVGGTSGRGSAGVALKLTVHLSAKIRSRLKGGKTVHLLATLTYTSALGGKPVVHGYPITIKGRRAKGRR